MTAISVPQTSSGCSELGVSSTYEWDILGTWIGEYVTEYSKTEITP